jgi:hypothetical protein
MEPMFKIFALTPITIPPDLPRGGIICHRYSKQAHKWLKVEAEKYFYMSP